MSALLNMNEKRLISWKGKTLNQITSSIQQNKGNIKTSNHNYFLPNPLKLYRREIASPFNNARCSRSSLSIDVFDRPGGSIVNTAATKINGLVNTIDNTLPNNACEKPGTCSVFLSPSEAAKRRCRSSGNITRKFDAQNRPKYYTDTKQYLTSRNLTAQQNEFKYSLTDESYCVTYKPNNVRFAQQGAADSSSLTSRVRYDTITTSAATMSTSYGKATTNALAYGVSETGYTIKDKVGYPLTKYPTFSSTGIQNVCSETGIKG
jgi:hypothetical protein